MCKAPILLPNGLATACHECQQCRQQAINDWVGRNIAENKTAVGASVVTLTYGKGRDGDADHERAAILTYSDIQKFLKLLRRHGYPVRYFIAGEYGSKKGRAHWHAILYWQAKKPDVPLRENIMYEHWSHGWAMWDDVTPKTVLYVAKYVQADKRDDGRQSMIRMSKKPPLGTAYFAELAETYVKQGLAPQSLEYTFPGVMWNDKGNRVPWRFRLKDVPATMYLDHYIEEWARVHGKRRIPPSDLIERYIRFGKIITSDETFELAKEAEYVEDEADRRFKRRTQNAEKARARRKSVPMNRSEWVEAYARENGMPEEQVWEIIRG